MKYAPCKSQGCLRCPSLFVDWEIPFTEAGRVSFCARLQNPTKIEGKFSVGVPSGIVLNTKYTKAVIATYTSWYTKSTTMGKNFNLDQIPDMTGKVCIVTGGNTGVSIPFDLLFCYAHCQIVNTNHGIDRQNMRLGTSQEERSCHCCFPYSFKGHGCYWRDQGRNQERQDRVYSVGLAFSCIRHQVH